MARVELSSPPTTLDTGILQLQNGVAMSSTLTSVTDQSNTASTLKLSTTSAQFTSPLRITTDDPSDFYLDCEDGSTNNRFSITRNTASQQVNLNFASNPAGSTTIVGAVRTYVDGTNLSEVMTFREDGYINAKGTLQVGTDGQSGSLVFPTTVSGFATSIFTTYANNRLTLQCGGATRIEFNSWLDFISSGNTLRMDGGTHTTTLSQSNIIRFVNTGFASTNTTYFVNTNVGVNETSPTAKLQIKGSGSTSATTSLLVQNSGAGQLFKIDDDGSVYLGRSGSTTWAATFLANTGIQGRIGNGAFETPNVIYTYNFGTTMTFYNNNNSATGFDFQFNNTPISDTTNQCMINLGGNYQTQQGFQFSSLRIAPIYNFNANTTTNAIARGIYYNPTITNLRVANHYGIQTTSGGAYINTATPQASACLQADSTTQGFLPPRMTDAQIRAIASPVNGLIAYNTDINHLCCYQAGAWVKFSHSPM
jgi:hypothetical protein